MIQKWKVEKRKQARMSLLKRALIGNFIFAPIITLMMVICFFLLSSQKNNSLPTIFDNMIVIIVSNSMKPEFVRGDVMTIKKVAAEDLKEGDVIAFYRYPESKFPSVIWFHRIVDIRR